MEKRKKEKREMRLNLNLKFKKVLQIAADVFSIFAAYFCSLLLRFGGDIPTEYISAFLYSIVPIVLIHLAIYFGLGLYRSLWETASIDELIKIVIGTTITGSVVFVISQVIGYSAMPVSIYIAAELIIMMLAGFTRLSYRIIRRLLRVMPRSVSKRVMIVGAGETGALIIRQLQESYSHGMVPVIVVDDDKQKLNMWLRGIRVGGNRYDISRLAAGYEIDVIIYCIPSARPSDRKEILQICFETGSMIKIVPGIREIINDGTMAVMRDIEMTDLLSRPEVKLETAGISEYLMDACVLVTGGGGSIGSELCRQIAPFHPKKIVIFDIYENNAYELLIEMRQKFPDIETVVEIGSIQDINRLIELFSTYKPNVVFHAAAHKHVPLMEDNPAEAVKNNVFGTWNTAQMADKYSVNRFVLISTDKAVNPSNVMGATKRLAEQVIQYMNSVSKTQFVAVRFGNVLGSNGSVIPLFKNQIAQGGPLTVTHKDMTRYFMTIPEAARLVLQAGSLAEKGELFILDMGEPVRIDDVAQTLIRLSGLRPEIDIKIIYTGLRPGEKLHEELFLQDETVMDTGIPGIYMGCCQKTMAEMVMKNLVWLRKQMDHGADVRECLSFLLATYNPFIKLGAEEVEDILAKEAIKAVGEKG